MSSTTSKPSPLGEFFSFKPKRLSPGPLPTRSENTRVPQAFDMHLIDDMILKHVVVVPEMVDDIMNIAQEAADALSKVPRPTKRSRTFTSQEALEKYFDLKGNAINDESNLQAYYSATAGLYCSTVAATLALDSKEWREDAIEWKIRTSDRTNKSKFEFPTGFGTRAFADGFLLATGCGAALLSTLALISTFFSTILIFEFKNLNFSTLERMENLLMTSLADTFQWTRCDLGQKCFTTCPENITGTKMGPDALQSQLPSTQRLRDNPSLAQPFTPSRATSRAQPKSKARAKSARKPTAKKQETPDPHGVLKSSYHLLQQVWAELCDNDATFGVITAGNAELIVERNRAFQTLYVSDYIDVPNVYYLKLHTGLGIAAIRDAEGRARLLRESPPREWKRSFDVLVDFRTHSEQGLPGAVIEEFKRRPWLILRTDDGPGAPAGPFFQDVTYLLHDSDENGVEMASDTSLTTITIKSEPNDRYTQQNHAVGTICFKKCALPSVSSLDAAMTVFLKTAGGREDVEMLRHECRVFQDLHSKNVCGIPTFARLFEYHDSPRGPFGVLATQFCGRSVRRCLADPEYPLNSVEMTLRDSFESILLSILAAGYTFEDLRADNFLLDGSSQDALSGIVTGLGELKPVKSSHSDRSLHSSLLKEGIRRLFKKRSRDQHDSDDNEFEDAEERSPKRLRLALNARNHEQMGLPQAQPLRRSFSLT